MSLDQTGRVTLSDVLAAFVEARPRGSGVLPIDKIRAQFQPRIAKFGIDEEAKAELRKPRSPLVIR